MFSVEPILWLQAHLAGPPVEALWMVSQLGTARAYVALVLLLGFGLRLRPALGVLIALLLAGIATDTLKATLALPRPSDVDDRIAAPRTPAPPAAVARGGAVGPWATLATSSVDAARRQPREGYGRDGRYGFPSGHVATAVAATWGICWFFGTRGLLPVAVLWPLLMALSRLTLGRHFLADVLGGLLIGAVVTAMAALVWPPGMTATTAATGGGVTGRFEQARIALLTGLAFLLALVALGSPLVDPRNPGRLLGAVVFMCWWRTTPEHPASATPRQRATGILAAAAAYLLLDAGAGWLLATLGAAWSGPASLLAGAATTAGTLAAGAILSSERASSTPIGPPAGTDRESADPRGAPRAVSE